jgi:hypothetical protein
LPVLLGWVSLVAADAPPFAPPEGEATGPKEIDFSPLPELKSGRYKIYIQCEAGSDRYAEVGDIDAQTGPTGVRDLFRASLDASGWEVKAVGDAKLVIQGTKKNGVGSVTIRLENPEALKGLSKDNTPTVRPAK